MLRSLNTVRTGLLGNQSRLDVIGNNIVNVNTPGFKASRASFQALLGDRMGLDPFADAGDGVSLASIDSIMTQGLVEDTGNAMDLAIEGRGFFALSLQGRQVYSRAGSFGMDGDGRIIQLDSGAALLGYGASDGRVDEGGSLGELRVDLSQVLPAEATTFIELGGNLDPDSGATGSVLEMGPFLKEAGGDCLLTALSMRGSGAGMGLLAGDTVTIGGWAGGSAIQSEPFAIQETSSLQDLADWIGTSIQSVDPSYPAGSVTVSGGRILLPGGSLDLENLTLQVEGNDLAGDVFRFPENIAAGAPPESGGQAIGVLEAADASDAILDLFSAQGESFGGPDSPFDLSGRDLELTGKLSGESRTSTFHVDAESKLADLMAAIASMAELDGSGETGVHCGEDGVLSIRGHVGAEFEISDLSILDASGELDFDGAFASREIQAASDSAPHTLSTDIIDGKGERRRLSLVFQLGDDGQGAQVWNWEARMAGGEQILSGGRGTLVFGEEAGSPPELRFEDGRGALDYRADEGGGTESVRIVLGHGADSVTGIAGGFDLGVTGNDGVESGSLQSVRIDETGTVEGLFSNGERRALARVALASFRNSAGLERIRDNLYSESGDSGRPLWRGQASEGIAARIRSGALEKSNVDLTQEFAQMIMTQRGFQANAKIVNVGDQMLSDAVSLKR